MTEISKSMLAAALGLWAAGILLAAPWEPLLEAATVQVGSATVTSVTQSADASAAIITGVPYALQAFGQILTNNLLVAVLIIGGGLISGGLLAYSGLLWNGFLLGATVRHALAFGIAPQTLAVGMTAHCVVEILALSMAGVCGMRGASLVASWVHDAEINSTLLPSCRLLRLIAALLLLAAFLEVGAAAIADAFF